MAGDPMLGHLQTLCEKTGWRMIDGTGVHVARHTKALRLPKPRFEEAEFPLRSSYVRLTDEHGAAVWRRLEWKIHYGELLNRQPSIGVVADVLVTFFHGRRGDTSHSTKDMDPCENA